MGLQSRQQIAQNIYALRFPWTAVNTWRRLWIILAIISATAITFIDSILLQRKLNYFTGGFLTVHYLREPADIMVFIANSIIADFGVTVLLVALALWFCNLVRLNFVASIITALVAATGPIIVIDFMSYRILDYMGDVFDVHVAYEIAGRSLNEIFVVSSAHLVLPMFLMLGAIGILIIIIRKANVYWRMPLPPSPAVVGLGALIGGIFLIALLVISTAIVSSESLKQGLRRKPSAKLFSIIGETLSDFDRDGYGLLHRPRDPDPFNKRIFPYAVEISGNGIDENGIAGDLPAHSVTQSDDVIRASIWKSRPNVIMIVLESLRADLIGKKSGGKQITPVFNELARQGISTDLSFVHVGFTVPSRYHLFSGRLMPVRGGTTLIDDFKANGYEVAYFSAEDESFGGEIFDIGFERADVAYDARVEPHQRFTMFSSPGSIALPYDVIVEKVFDFLANRRGDKPLFLYVKFQDLHFPYNHSGIVPMLNGTALTRAEIKPERADDLWATYVNTAANVDYAAGEIIKAAKRFLMDTAPGIIVTADHGESLFDNGFLGHGFALNDIQTRVPFIVVNLPIIVKQPFGQTQLRAALNYALESETGESEAPVLTEDQAGYVFQFLGDIKRPRQIALRGASGRTIYDFRTDRVQISANSWKRPNELTDNEFFAFRDMVNLWERMIIESSTMREER
jgi:hypothetical protein